MEVKSSAVPYLEAFKTGTAAELYGTLIIDDLQDLAIPGVDFARTID
jgi:hypothetical protein